MELQISFKSEILEKILYSIVISMMFEYANKDSFMNRTKFEDLSLFHAYEMRGHTFSQSSSRNTFDWTRSREKLIFLLIFFCKLNIHLGQITFSLFIPL